MPLFRYYALSGNGKRISGTIDADSLQEAKVKLIRREISAIRIEKLSEQELRPPLSKRELLTFTREIGRLLHAGLALFEALSALEEKYRTQKNHRLFLDLCDQVKSGRSFSQALTRHPLSFDLLYTSMIANAEKTGRLALSLDELAQLLTRQLQIRKQVLSALLYPALLFTFCLVVLSSLLFFVIPSLRELFDGRELHPFTKIVFGLSQWACHAKGALFALAFLSLSCLIGSYFIPSWRKRFFTLAQHLPMLKNLFAKVSLIRFCRASAALLEGGLPLIAAFSQAGSVMRHPDLEALVARAGERISQGEPISAPFIGHALVPPLVPRMLGIAEQSGKLSFTMHQIAQIYEDELETTLTYFATAAQPALLLFLGALVGFVLLSVLLPLTDVSSFVN